MNTTLNPFVPRDPGPVRGNRMKTGLNATLDPTRRSNAAQDFDTALRRKIVGQDQAVEKVAEIYQMFLAGLNPPGRPIGNLLFLGPTGSGKTRVVEAVAESLFGDPKAVLLTTVQPLVNDLRKTELGETLTALEGAVDAGEAIHPPQ